MSVLSGPAILQCVDAAPAIHEGRCRGPLIEIDPFDPARLGPNSYDVALADALRVYRPSRYGHLDSRAENPTDELPIYEGGTVLMPGELYLGATVERVRCEGLVPYIDGRSSFGRLGLSVHVTAGRGDDGWNGRLTLELTVVKPLRVYAGDLVAQLTFHTLEGARAPYRGRYQHSNGPVASRAHLPRPEPRPEARS